VIRIQGSAFTTLILGSLFITLKDFIALALKLAIVGSTPDGSFSKGWDRQKLSAYIAAFIFP
jgi:hypothetical protein